MDKKHSLFLKALRAENDSRPPVWLMRQAGRYMASYRKIKEKYTLSQMFHQKDLITEITYLPVKQLDVDAAILFSDILLPLEALGFSVEYDTGKGPQVFPKTFDIAALPRLEYSSLQERFRDVTEAIQQLKKKLNIPLIGFCGAPFTLASYILEKESHHLLKATKEYLYRHPQEFHKLLEKLTELSVGYLKLQIEAGVDAIQIFDSWAGMLDQENFVTFSVQYLKKILDALKPTNIPRIVFCRGSSLFTEELVTLQPEAISFDWYKPMHLLKEKVPFPIALQGNLDPDLLKASFAEITQKTQKLLHSMKGETRFIANLGHGVSPDISEEAVKCFVDTVKGYS
jgi:uroporphyrinogen decarboxylase